MRYIYTVVIYVFIHLLSIYTALGKLPALTKATTGAYHSSDPGSEENFSEGYPFLNQQAKKTSLNAVLFVTLREWDKLISSDLQKANTNLYPAYHLSLFNFLYPKHVFW